MGKICKQCQKRDKRILFLKAKIERMHGEIEGWMEKYSQSEKLIKLLEEKIQIFEEDEIEREFDNELLKNGVMIS